MSFVLNKYRTENLNLLILNYFALFFLFLSAIILNDYFDRKGDAVLKRKNPFINGFSKKDFMFYFVFFMILSLILSSYSWKIFFLFFLSHVLHITYSARPLRIKRIFPLNILFLGFAAFLSFNMGFLIIKDLKDFPFVFLLIFLFSITPAITFRDLLDVEGDKIQKVQTLPTLLGENKGFNITSFIVLFSYIISVIILKFIYLLPFALIMGMLSFYEIRKKRKMSQYKLFNYYFLYLFIVIVFIIFFPEIL